MLLLLCANGFTKRLGGGIQVFRSRSICPIRVFQGELFNVMMVHCKGLVINYGEGGATKWENRRSETFCAPPLKTG